MIQKYLKKYQGLQAPVKASLWFLICGFAQKGIAMFTIPIFARIMTEAEYGRFSVYHSWFSIVEIIIGLDIAGSVFTRGLIKNENHQDRFASSMMGLSTTCIALWTIVYFLFRNQICDLLDLSHFLTVAMIMEVWTHSAYLFWANKERANFRYKKLVLLTVMYVVLRPLFGICFVLWSDVQTQVEGRVVSIVLVNALLFVPLYVSIMRKGRQFFSKEYWLYALKFTIPLLPHCLSHVLLSQTDRLMINVYCGAEYTAYYSIAYTLATVLQILNQAVVVSLNPWMYRKMKNGEYGKIGKISYGFLALMVLANLGVVMMAPELMTIIAPASYQVAVWVVPPVMTSVFFMSLYSLFVIFEYYFEKTHYVTLATMMAAVLNVVLNALLIPRFGFVAAGYTTMVCYAMCALAHYCFMRKIARSFMNGAVVYNTKIILALTGVLLGASGVTMLLYEQTILRYGLLLVLAAVIFCNRKTFLQIAKSIKKKEE